ncbi:RNA polymerase sigma-70 factor [Nafulsella turpanensis]|uniref:RNA polymerase sigma-70 factor n=1 Tax=Nafulsella turpanensis TaxID=1265690 RepID=UPI00034CF28A|nr:RNA polymerase sigma-70 factor [Nafulsella turpanensis]
MSAREDEAYFEEIFKRNYQRICQRVYRITHDLNAAEDIVQEVFISFWNKPEQTIQTPDAYLYKASINKALNYVSSTQRRKQLQEEQFKAQKQEAGQNPQQELEQQELELQIQQIIDKLPPMCQKVFMLSRYEGMSHQQIASFLEISPNTVDNHIKKALAAFRKVLLGLFLALLQIYFYFFS